MMLQVYDLHRQESGGYGKFPRILEDHIAQKFQAEKACALVAEGKTGMEAVLGELVAFGLRIEKAREIADETGLKRPVIRTPLFEKAEAALRGGGNDEAYWVLFNSVVTGGCTSEEAEAVARELGIVEPVAQKEKG